MSSSSSPHIHKKWEPLRAKIQDKYEPLRIEKRIGMDKTIVFRVEELEYDRRIPILKRKHLDRWIKIRDKPASSKHRHELPRVTPFSFDVSKPQVPPLSPPPSPPQQQQQHQHQQPSQPAPEQPVDESVNSPKLSDEEPLDDIKVFEIDSDSSDSETIGHGNIDCLQIKVDDEDYQYDDEDDEIEETTLSRNLKKIRTEPEPPKKSTATASTTSKTPKASTSVSTSSPSTRPTSSNPFAAPPPPSAAQIPTNSVREQHQGGNQQVRQPQFPPKPPQVVDWPEVKRHLSKNLFYAVYRDLTHFKKDIPSNEGKQVLKEAVIKTIQEDETYFLCDFLKLALELKYADDANFWAELVQRFKRKLSTHALVKTFKVKTDPELVYKNYERAMVQVANHVAELDLSLNLPYHTILYIEKLRVGSTKTLTNGQPDAKPKIKAEIKVEHLKQEGQTGEPNKQQENTTPRRVLATKTPEGKQIFEISAPKRTKRATVLRARL